jgi:hypothetical protein
VRTSVSSPAFITVGRSRNCDAVKNLDSGVSAYGDISVRTSSSEAGRPSEALVFAERGVRVRKWLGHARVLNVAAIHPADMHSGDTRDASSMHSGDTRVVSSRPGSIVAARFFSQ